jgi:hypothetical protein
MVISAACLSMISAQTLRVYRERKPVHFPDHVLTLASIGRARKWRIDA